MAFLPLSSMGGEGGAGGAGGLLTSASLSGTNVFLNPNACGEYFSGGGGTDGFGISSGRSGGGGRVSFLIRRRERFRADLEGVLLAVESHDVSSSMSHELLGEVGRIIGLSFMVTACAVAGGPEIPAVFATKGFGALDGIS